MTESENKEKKIKLTLPQALEKIKNWCAYQERSHFETLGKLYDFGINKTDAENIIAVLISENFLNEERFANAFVSGKMRIKHWGRNKIRSELRFRKISEYSISKALKNIDEKEYLGILEKIINKKSREVKEKDPRKKTYKIIQYAIGKGFETDLINEIIKTENN